MKDIKIIELMDLFDDDEEITTADKVDRPQTALDRDMFKDFEERNPKMDGGMLVQPSADGSRPGYRGLTEKEKTKLKKELGDDYKKLKFSEEYQKNYPDRIDYGVRQRNDKPLFRKVVNILSPGSQSSASKIINNEKLTNTLIKSTNAGDDIQTIIKKINKLDKSLSRAQISSAINALVARGKIKEKFGRVAGQDLTIGEQKAFQKIIEKEVKDGKLNRAQIARKAEVADSVVQDWIVANKGQDFYDENYTYEKGRLKTGTLQKQKDLFNYIETVDNISAKEIKKLFDMGSGKETQKLMSDLVSVIYRMTGNTKTGSLVVPYDDEGRMREVLSKIRNAPDFEDIYQRRIGDLIRQAYPKGAKRNQAIKSLGEYYKFSRALKEIAPELALSLDHVVPFQFLEEVKQGKNPMNLIKVKPIPQAVNRFKANFDSARIEINRALKINPTDKNTLNKFKLLKELEQITPLEFGGVSAKGNVYDFKAKPIGQSNLIEDAIEGLKTYNRIGKFSKQVLTDETLQKKLIKAGVETGKDFSAFKKITPISKAVEDKVINTIVSYSKLKKCQISLNADGGRIGFANSIECIQDGLNETKKAAAAGDKVAAKRLVETAEAAAKGGKLLKNFLGPGAILGEALFEGAIIGNKLLEGKPLKQAWAESYLSYLDPRKYRGELDPTLLQRERMLKSSAYKTDLQEGFDAQDRISAFNKARDQEFLAEQRGRDDQLMTEAEREKQRAYEKQSSPFIQDSQLQKDANIISSEAFKDASNLAQEYIQGQEGQKQFDLGVLSVPRGGDSMRVAKADTAMKDLYTQYSDQDIIEYLKQLKDIGALEGNVQDFIDYRETPINFPAGYFTEKKFQPKTLSGLDLIKNMFQIEEANQRVIDAGGVANLASGGIAEGPPPESGPTPQGLPYVYKNVKKIKE